MSRSARATWPRALIPWSLTLLRAALAPVVVALALWAPRPALFAACLVAAFLSDVFDGIVARRLGVATPGLRRADSLADSAFYFAAIYAVWRLHPAVILGFALPLLVLAGLEALRYGVDWFKFRREASYHMWTSKLWGIALFLAFYGVLARDGADGFVAAAIGLGIFCDVEGLLISLVLPVWMNDVPTLVHALRLRRSLVAAGTGATGRLPGTR